MAKESLIKKCSTCNKCTNNIVFHSYDHHCWIECKICKRYTIKYGSKYRSSSLILDTITEWNINNGK